MANYKKYNQLSEKKFNEFEVMNVQNRDHRVQLLKENGIVCIDVWADWCQPCKDALPVYTEMAKKYSGNCLLIKEELNPNLAKEYDLSQVPTFLIFIKGQLHKKIAGFNPEDIEGTLNTLLGLFQQAPDQPKNNYTTLGTPFQGGANKYKQNYGQ